MDTPVLRKFAEVTDDFSMNFFIQFLEELGQLLSILKVFEELPQTSAKPEYRP